MAKHPEVCFLVLAILIVFLGRYGSSLQTKTVTEPPKDPRRFFPTQSNVIDLPYGNLEPVVNILEREQFIFVMYYAPWCAKSMSLRLEFQKAAKFMNKQVKFIGVNCWWPEGSCRKRYKFRMFPVLFAYFSDLDGYHYLGAPSAEYMVKFLEDLIYPLSLIHTGSQILDIVAKYDTAVIGYFDFNSSPQPPGYLQYYYASMRSVEHDPYQIMKYGIVTEYSLASVYNLTNISDIVLLRSANTSLNYPSDANYTSSSIVSWVLQNRQKYAVKLITPLGVKSLTLSRQISLGPSLILFTPINQLFDINVYFHMLKSVSLRFNYGCGKNNSFDSGAVINSLQTFSFNMTQKYKSVIKMCEQLKKQSVSKTFDSKCCVTVVNHSESKNVCEFCQHKLSPSPISITHPNCAIDLNSRSMSISKLTSDLDVNICLKPLKNYNSNEHSSFSCKACTSAFEEVPDSLKTTTHRRRTDRYVDQNLELLPIRLCRRLTLQKIQSLPVVPVNQDFYISQDFSGLGCKQNKSLQFYAIDSLHHSLFAKRLGIDIQTLSDHPAAVIIDKEAEEHYILRKNFTSNNVATFIVNFTAGQLRRKLVSFKTSVGACTEKDVCVTELTSQTFHQYIQRPDQDVVVLVYAAWCGYCTCIHHMYLSLMKYFRLNKNIVFTRIDGDINNLPWEYTVDQYPTIIFFPAKRKSDSVVYPESVAYTLPNLIKFVLQHSTFKLRTEAAVSVCTKMCIQKNSEYAQRMAYLLKQRINRLQTRFRFITKITTGYGKFALSVLSQKIMNLLKQLEKVKKLEEYLRNSKYGIEYTKLAQFINS